MTFSTIIIALKGSSLSGNWGHAGRLGKKGGSAPKSGIGAALSLRTGHNWEIRRDAKLSNVPINKSTYDEVTADIYNEYDKPTIDKALNNLKSLIKDAPVSIRIPDDILPFILKDGKFKNQHESGRSEGDFDPSYRKEAERNAFGNQLNKPEDFPIYGYVATGRNGYTPPVEFYGTTRVVLKDDVKNRTTITAKDSLEPFVDKAIVGTSILDPKAASLDGDMEHIANTGKPYYTYVEAQIHGGVTLKDIKHVYILDSTDTRMRIVPQLNSAGISYTLVDPLISEADLERLP